MNENVKSHFKHLSVYKLHNTWKRTDSMRFSCESPHTFENVNTRTHTQRGKKYNLEKCGLTVDLTNSHFSKWYNNKSPAMRIFLLTTENMLFSSSNYSGIPSVLNTAFPTTTIAGKKWTSREKNIEWRCVVRSFFSSRDGEGNEESWMSRRRK